MQGVVVHATGNMEGQDGNGKIICCFGPSPEKYALNMIPTRGLWGLNMSFVIQASKL